MKPAASATGLSRAKAATGDRTGATIIDLIVAISVTLDFVQEYRRWINS